MAPSENIDEALNAIVRLLGRQRIPYMVMGGLALSIWGRVRVTQDVDLAIGLDEPREAGFIQSLPKAHFLPTSPRAIVGHRLIVCRYLKTAEGMPIQVDLFLAHGAYQRQAIRRAVSVPLGHRSIRVIAPEDLVLYKLIADRPIDRLDIQTIVEEQAGQLNRAYLTRWGTRLGISKRLKPLLKKS